MARATKYVKPLVLSVFMSNRFVYAQVVHKPTAFTLVNASSREDAVREGLESTSDKAAAARVGEMLALRMREREITAVAFEMAPTQRYHGKLRAVLDGLTRSGIKLL